MANEKITTGQLCQSVLNHDMVDRHRRPPEKALHDLGFHRRSNSTSAYMAGVGYAKCNTRTYSQIRSRYAFRHARNVARLPVRVSPCPPLLFSPPSPSETSVYSPLLI